MEQQLAQANAHCSSASHGRFQTHHSALPTCVRLCCSTAGMPYVPSDSELFLRGRAGDRSIAGCLHQHLTGRESEGVLLLQGTGGANQVAAASKRAVHGFFTSLAGKARGCSLAAAAAATAVGRAVPLWQAAIADENKSPHR